MYARMFVYVSVRRAYALAPRVPTYHLTSYALTRTSARTHPYPHIAPHTEEGVLGECNLLLPFLLLPKQPLDHVHRGLAAVAKLPGGLLRVVLLPGRQHPGFVP